MFETFAFTAAMVTFPLPQDRKVMHSVRALLMRYLCCVLQPAWQVQLAFAGELSVVLAARLVVADDADEVLVDLALALAVGGRRLLMLGEDEYAMN